MSRVIQITVSVKGSLFALTDDGDIYVRTRRSAWRKLDSPVPPRFSLPEEYEQSLCQGSATEPEDSPEFNPFNGPGQGVFRTRTQKPPARRPTSIGPDGNYIPKVQEPAHAVKAIGWCIRKASLLQGGDPDYVGYLGFVYSDGSAGVSDRHYSSSEQFSWHDIRLRLKNRDTGLSLDWLGCVQESDERLKTFANPEF